ncbi:unnamed protein product, partial [Prorocentrum cordatum]
MTPDVAWTFQIDSSLDPMPEDDNRLMIWRSDMCRRMYQLATVEKEISWIKYKLTSLGGIEKQVGLENGALHRFNLQSGLHRGSIPRSDSVAPLASAAGELDEEAGLPKPERPPHKKAAAVPPPRAHRGRVCGVSVTVSGTVLSVASNPKDCALRIWKLATHEAVAAVDLGRERPGAPSCLLLRVQGALAAVSLDDGALLLVDLHGQ